MIFIRLLKTGILMKDINKLKEDKDLVLVITSLITSKIITISIVPHSIIIFFLIEEVITTSTPVITPV